MATSCKLCIVELAYKEYTYILHDFHFVTENSNEKSVGLEKGNINVLQNFCTDCLITRTTSCQKRSFCYLETLNRTQVLQRVSLLIPMAVNSCAHIHLAPILFIAPRNFMES